MAESSGQQGSSAADRISQLNDIDKDVAELLHHAGAAIKSLTVAPQESDGGQNNQNQDVEERMAAFSAASSQYFSVLSSIDVRLRRHITALEDADILPSEAVLLNFHTVQSEVDPPQRTSAKSKNTITNGGLGNLDIGWLNSRNNDIEKTMEAELWEQAQGLVQKTLVDKSTSEDDADVPMSNGSGTYTG